MWRRTSGQTGSGLAADGDRNGKVDQADYDLWRTNFGAALATTATSTQTVPEPMTLNLAILFSWFFGLVKRLGDSNPPTGG
jgi:hypothetical protein